MPLYFDCNTTLRFLLQSNRCVGNLLLNAYGAGGKRPCRRARCVRTQRAGPRADRPRQAYAHCCRTDHGRGSIGIYDRGHSCLSITFTVDSGTGAPWSAYSFSGGRSRLSQTSPSRNKKPLRSDRPRKSSSLHLHAPSRGKPHRDIRIELAVPCG